MGITANRVKYIIENPRDALWGLSVTTVGCEKISPGESYPTGRHLESHSFSPDKGRIICLMRTIVSGVMPIG